MNKQELSGLSIDEVRRIYVMLRDELEERNKAIRNKAKRERNNSVS